MYIQHLLLILVQGGWNKELTGFWVAKYETSRGDATNTSSGISNVAKAVPGVRRWDDIKIGDAFIRAKYYNTTLSSHLMKNSEWGAVAYLAHSEYGRNGTEVTINNNSNKLTGYAGNSIDADSSSFNTFEYNTKEGLLASTTGNIFGVYDMCGGGYEYVSAYNAENEDNILSSYGSPFIYSEDDSEVNIEGSNYATAYGGSNESFDFKIGDATLETKGWNADANVFLSSDAPFFLRGGSYINKDSAGIFYYHSEIGGAFSNYCFRICLVPNGGSV